MNLPKTINGATLPESECWHNPANLKAEDFGPDHRPMTKTEWERTEKYTPISFYTETTESHWTPRYGFLRLKSATYRLHATTPFLMPEKEWELSNEINGHTLQPWQRWHREDWTQEMLPHPYRPLTLDEIEQREDEYSSQPSCDEWTPGPTQGGARSADYHRRTTRPLPKVETSEREEFEQIQAKLNRGHLLGRRPENPDHYSHAGTEFCWLTFKAAREANP